MVYWKSVCRIWCLLSSYPLGQLGVLIPYILFLAETESDFIKFWLTGNNYKSSILSKLVGLNFLGIMQFNYWHWDLSPCVFHYDSIFYLVLFVCEFLCVLLDYKQNWDAEIAWSSAMTVLKIERNLWQISGMFIILLLVWA